MRTEVLHILGFFEFVTESSFQISNLGVIHKNDSHMAEVAAA